MMRKILIPLVFLILVGGAIGYYMYNKPRANLKGSKADFSLTADQLFDQYTADVDKGNTTFLDKVVQVEGKLEEIVSKDNGKVSLMITAASAPVGGINAELDDRYADATGLEAGQQIVVKGFCAGLQEMDLFQDVILKSCLVVK